MAKLSLTDLANLSNEASVVAAINANNTATETALENTLSRDGTSPNQMGASLDMNSYRILNLPDAVTAQEPVTLSQLDGLGSFSSETTSFTPSGGISADTVQAAIEELDTEKAAIADLAAVAFSGSGSDIDSGNMGLTSLVLTGGTLAPDANVVTLTATQPAVPTASQNAIQAQVTGAGSAAFSNRAFNCEYLAGYTGSSMTTTARFANFNVGTGSTLIPASGVNNPTANVGASGVTAGDGSGVNIGVYGNSSLGDTNVGLLGLAQVAKTGAGNKRNIGVVGTAYNAVTGGSTPYQIGGFFSLNQTTVPTDSAALIVDNGAQTDPVARFRVAGVDKFTIASDGQPLINAAVQPTISVRATTGAATTQMARFIYDPASGLTNPGFLFQTLSDAGAFASNDNVFWNGGGVTVGGVTYPGGAGGLRVEGTTAATSTTTGSLIVAGGAGVAGKIYADEVIPTVGSPGLVYSSTVTVDFSAAGDTAIPVPLPTGKTRFMGFRVKIFNASATLVAATYGVFPTTGGGGTPLVAAGAAISVNTAADATANNSQSSALSQTITYVGASLTTPNTVYFRVGSTAAGTGKVVLEYYPLD